MDIKVINNIPNINVTVNKSEDGSFAILVAEKKKTLGDVVPGEVVKIGNREYIVLGHGKETTSVITKEIVKNFPFGKIADWVQSNVRSYCNGDFYNELANIVGKKNIIQHTVSLIADDGTRKENYHKDNVSILTTEQYRRYRKFLPAYGNWWWTATRANADNDSYSRSVCCVNSDGVLCWNGCGLSSGVRPFCILNSSISIS